MRLVKCASNKKLNGLLEFNRFYARGPRYLPTDRLSNNVDSEEKQHNNKSSDAEVSQMERTSRTLGESPKQLLENAASFREATSHNKIKERVEDIWNSDPYPKNSNWKQSQAKHSIRPHRDPRGTSIILFPGQGNWPVLNQSLTKPFFSPRYPICWNGKRIITVSTCKKNV